MLKNLILYLKCSPIDFWLLLFIIIVITSNCALSLKIHCILKTQKNQSKCKYLDKSNGKQSCKNIYYAKKFRQNRGNCRWDNGKCRGFTTANINRDEIKEMLRGTNWVLLLIISSAGKEILPYISLARTLYLSFTIKP